jgi:sodium transport system ATP-binding protein
MPEPTGSPMIHVEHLSKHFSDFRRGSIVALEGVSFDVHPGEIFGLLGPNGAGKTTCLRVLSTVLTPTSGIATVAGYDVLTQAADVRARIGFMSGNTGIYDRMTAWELVEYFARLYGMEEPLLSQRLNEIFTTLQMHEFRDVLGSKMSTGMKQKVSIARTIVHNPPVLIFDEPTTGLDVLVARAVLKQIESLRKQGKCIIFSTHIMREVEKLCDRVAIIHKGRILAAGTPTELLDRSGQSDFEELFFELISQAEERMAATS